MAYNTPRELVLIDTKTASNSATISFTTGISTNFSVYFIKIRNMVVASDTANILMLFSTNGGSSYLSSNYDWGYVNGGSNPFTSGVNGAADSKSQIGNFLSNTSSNACNGDIKFFNLADSTNIKTYFFYSNSINSGNNDFYFVGGGRNSGTTAINAIRFQASTGNITSGTFYLYGVTEV